MEHLDVPQFLGLLVVMLGAAKLGGALAQRVGQPAVLGELVAGVLLGGSVVGLVNPTTGVLHLLAEQRAAGTIRGWSSTSLCGPCHREWAWLPCLMVALQGCIRGLGPGERA